MSGPAHSRLDQHIRVWTSTFADLHMRAWASTHAYGRGRGSPSQAQPEPKRAAAAALNCFFISSKDPKLRQHV
eukprot:2589446-Rhodomonas_salina.4